MTSPLPHSNIEEWSPPPLALIDDNEGAHESLRAFIDSGQASRLALRLDERISLRRDKLHRLEREWLESVDKQLRGHRGALILLLDLDLGLVSNLTFRVEVVRLLECSTPALPSKEWSDYVPILQIDSATHVPVKGPLCQWCDAFGFALAALETFAIDPLLISIMTRMPYRRDICRILTRAGTVIRRKSVARFGIHLNQEYPSASDEEADDVIDQILTCAHDEFVTRFGSLLERTKAAWGQMGNSIEYDVWHKDLAGTFRGLFPANSGRHQLHQWKEQFLQSVGPGRLTQLIQRFLYSAGFDCTNMDEAQECTLETCWQLPCLKAVQHNSLHPSLLLAAAGAQLTDKSVLTKRVKLTIPARSDKAIRPWEVLFYFRSLVAQGFMFESQRLSLEDRDNKYFRIVLRLAQWNGTADDLERTLVLHEARDSSAGIGTQRGEMTNASYYVRLATQDWKPVLNGEGVVLTCDFSVSEVQ